jgi:hypothetical protein
VVICEAMFTIVVEMFANSDRIGEMMRHDLNYVPIDLQSSRIDAKCFRAGGN